MTFATVLLNGPTALGIEAGSGSALRRDECDNVGEGASAKEAGMEDRT